MGVGPEYPNASYNARRAPQRHHGELGSSNDPRGSRLGCLVVIGSGGILEREFCTALAGQVLVSILQ